MHTPAVFRTWPKATNLSDLQSRLNAEYLMFAFINGPALKEALVGAADPQTETLLGDATLNALDAYTGLVVWADEPGFRIDTISVPTDGSTDSTIMAPFDGTLRRTRARRHHSVRQWPEPR